MYGGTALNWLQHGSLTAKEVPGADYPATAQALLEAGSPVPEKALGNPVVAQLLIQWGSRA
jgi:hypothetical protein